MNQVITLSNQIRAIRALRGMSQTCLAEKAHLRQDRISEIERGVMPNATELERIKTALDWDAALALLSGQAAPTCEASHD